MTPTLHQQPLVTMPNGSIYEWDNIDGKYYCTHANTRNEVVSVDTFMNGEHDEYNTTIIVCENPECDEDVTEEVLNHGF